MTDPTDLWCAISRVPADDTCTITAERVFATDAADLWDAVTSPERWPGGSRR